MGVHPKLQFTQVPIGFRALLLKVPDCSMEVITFRFHLSKALNDFLQCFYRGCILNPATRGASHSGLPCSKGGRQDISPSLEFEIGRTARVTSATFSQLLRSRHMQEVNCSRSAHEPHGHATDSKVNKWVTHHGLGLE